MPALATNILRELPTVSDYINDRFNVFKSSNPWANFENFAVDEINSLLKNSRNFDLYSEFTTEAAMLSSSYMALSK